jgi:regulator of extracellular matrix RemA (YlzA/DUF370 family)
MTIALSPARTRSIMITWSNAVIASTVRSSAMVGVPPFQFIAMEKECAGAEMATLTR